MMLFSTERNANKKQIEIDNAVFDPSLMQSIRFDMREKFISFEYDLNECGHPLNLPFKADYVEFGVRVTPHGIHTSATIEPSDDELDDLEDYLGDIGEIEFDVRMTGGEKVALMSSLLLFTMQDDKHTPCIPEFEDDDGDADVEVEVDIDVDVDIDDEDDDESNRKYKSKDKKGKSKDVRKKKLEDEIDILVDLIVDSILKR